MRRSTQLLVMVILLVSCKQKTNMLDRVKKFNDYPSASAIEYLNGRYYMMGDDSRQLLILDNEFNIIDSIPLYSFAEKRMPRSTKSDMEAITILNKKQLLLLGSGSLSPYRDRGWLIDPVTKRKDSIRLDTFYKRLHNAGLKVINIEGASAIPGWILLANRGNYGWRNNHLVLLHEGFWKDQDSTAVELIRLGGNADSIFFNGVSGLAYAKRSDKLLLSVSTEQTGNSTDDGVIGKSYLWIINNISSKKNWKAINPNQVIDLQELDPRFAGQKIESVCVSRETRTKLELVLVADNDDGSSTVFKIIIKKE